MFDLKFKTKTIKTYGKRGRRVVSYLEKNSDFERLAAHTTFPPSHVNSFTSVANSGPSVATEPKAPWVSPTKPTRVPAHTSVTSESSHSNNFTTLEAEANRLGDTRPKQVNLEAVPEPMSTPATSPVTPRNNNLSDLNERETSCSKTTEDAQCLPISPAQLTLVSSHHKEHENTPNNDPSSPTSTARQCTVQTRGFVNPKNKSLLETNPLTDFPSPLRTRSGKQLGQTTFNKHTTTGKKRMAAKETTPQQTPRKPSDHSNALSNDQPVPTSKSLKRIVVNSPKPYKFSPFPKRMALEPCRIKNFEVLVTPMRLRSKPCQAAFSLEKIESPMKVDSKTPVAPSTPLSRNIPILSSPGCMSGSPFKRRISTLTRSSVSKELASQGGVCPQPRASKQQLKTLEDLLQLFGQPSVATFESFLGEGSLATLTKIGEATFSEVFSCTYSPLGTTVALKVLPFGKGKEVPVNGETQKSAHEIYQEASIALTLSSLGTSGVNSEESHRAHFIQVHRVGICQGKYPQELLNQWDEWAELNLTENERPDFFSDDQLYCVFVLDHGGKDLEHVKLKNWDQAQSILTQVAYSMGLAEKHLSFEHRDLHWGNIMVAPTEQEYFHFSEPSGETFVIPSFGIRATIIDYTLSRLERNQDIFYVSIDDEEIFAGEGDYQFEIYRKMEHETGHDWAGYYPQTNIFWFHYLNDKLLNSKRLLKRATARRPLASLQDRILTYTSVQELLGDPIFEKNREPDEKLISSLKQLSLE